MDGEFRSEQNNNQSGGSSSAGTTTKMGIDAVDIQDNGGPQSRRGQDIAESVGDEREEATSEASEDGIKLLHTTADFHYSWRKLNSKFLKTVALHIVSLEPDGLYT